MLEKQVVHQSRGLVGCSIEIIKLESWIIGLGILLLLVIGHVMLVIYRSVYLIQ